MKMILSCRGDQYVCLDTVHYFRIYRQSQDGATILEKEKKEKKKKKKKEHSAMY